MRHATRASRKMIFILAVWLFFAPSCKKQLYPVKEEVYYYNISNPAAVDSTVIRFIAPYRDSLEKDMAEVVAESSLLMEKGKPESLLGNFIADLLLEKGKQLNNGEADFCIVNYGGLRLPSLPAGKITTGMIYELMPFDNFLVTMDLSGKIVGQMLDHIASQGGWPVAGIKFKIKDGKAFDILINNLPLQPDKNYRVVISDYLADGGDNLFMLPAEKRDNSGLFIRDVILEYLREQSRSGKKISSELNQRITAE